MPGPETVGTDQLDEIRRLEILDAFATGDFVRAVRLCLVALQSSPNSQFATTYLEKAEAAWDKGYGVPIDLRRQFQRANSLVRARRFRDARQIYEDILAQANKMGVWHWAEVEQALGQVDNLEMANQMVQHATELISADRWEEALDEYRQAFSIAPDLPHLASSIEQLQRLIEHSQLALALQGTSPASLFFQIHDLQNSLVYARTLAIQRPSSKRVEDLVVAIESLLSAASESAIQLVNECLQLADQIPDLRTARGLLRRAQAISFQIQHLPIAAEAKANLETAILYRANQLNVARSLDEMIAIRKTSTDGSTLSALIQDGNLHTQLAGITQWLHQIQFYAKESRHLLPAIELCQRALSCTNLEAVAQLPADIGSATDRDAPKWASEWERAHSALVAIAQKARKILSSNSDDHVREVRFGLEDLKSIATSQFAPLQMLTDMIAVHWLHLIDQRFPQNQRGANSILPDNSAVSNQAYT